MGSRGIWRERDGARSGNRGCKGEGLDLLWKVCFHITKGGDLYVPHCEREIMILPEFAWD